MRTIEADVKASPDYVDEVEIVVRDILSRQCYHG